MMKLSDYVDINPKTQLPKGVQVPYVGMDAVTAGRRKVTANERREAKGSGAKFLPGDTLFARITPCLENGKIAQFSDTEAGLGSTEFFVLRAKQNVSDQDFVFYFSLQEELRAAAEKSMTGASGRQRADVSSLKEFECEFPSLVEQRRIAGILSAYDELIENNQRRIRILEDMARSLYREWFVHFRYPGHESVPLVDSPLGQMPQGWDCGRLDEVLVLQRGFDLPKDEREDGAVPIIAATGINGFHSVAKVKAPGVVTGRSGSIGTVLYVHEDFWPLNTALWIKEFPKSEPLFAYYLLSSLELKQFNSGAAVPTLNRNDVHGVQVVIPPRELQRRFQLNAGAMIEQAHTLQRKTGNLRRTRDMLLPRLLSGGINIQVTNQEQRHV